MSARECERLQAAFDELREKVFPDGGRAVYKSVRGRITFKAPPKPVKPEPFEMKKNIGTKAKPIIVETETAKRYEKERRLRDAAVQLFHSSRLNGLQVVDIPFRPGVDPGALGWAIIAAGYPLSGISSFDVDGDGVPDVYVAQLDGSATAEQIESLPDFARTVQPFRRAGEVAAELGGLLGELQARAMSPRVFPEDSKEMIDLRSRMGELEAEHDLSTATEPLILSRLRERQMKKSAEKTRRAELARKPAAIKARAHRERLKEEARARLKAWGK